MACMCGDIHCSVCGPAQGNYRCVLCKAWADDGCEHLDAETGEIREEFRAEAWMKQKEEEEFWAGIDRLVDAEIVARQKARENVSGLR